jgi:hypothetical protein
MLHKLFEHLLIWLAASAIIVVGLSWAYVLGIAGQRTGPLVLGWTVATASSIFSAALVQRAPLSIVLLVALSAVAMPFGGWMMAQGEEMAGLAYVGLGLTYVATLGPQARRWISGRR